MRRYLHNVKAIIETFPPKRVAEDVDPYEKKYEFNQKTTAECIKHSAVYFYLPCSINFFIASMAVRIALSVSCSSFASVSIPSAYLS